MGFNFPHEAVNTRSAGVGVLAGCLVKKGVGDLDIAVTHGLVRIKDRIDENNPLGKVYEIKGALGGTDKTKTIVAADGDHYLYAHPTVDSNGVTTGVELKLEGETGVPEANFTPNQAFAMTAAPMDGYWFPGRSIKLAKITVADGAITAIDNTVRVEVL